MGADHAAGGSRRGVFDREGVLRSGGKGFRRVEAGRGSGSMRVSGRRGAGGMDQESRKEDLTEEKGKKEKDGPDAIRTRDPRRVRAMS